MDIYFCHEKRKEKIYHSMVFMPLSLTVSEILTYFIWFILILQCRSTCLATKLKNVSS